MKVIYWTDGVFEWREIRSKSKEQLIDLRRAYDKTDIWHTYDLMPYGDGIRFVLMMRRWIQSCSWSDLDRMSYRVC